MNTICIYTGIHNKYRNTVKIKQNGIKIIVVVYIINV